MRRPDLPEAPSHGCPTRRLSGWDTERVSHWPGRHAVRVRLAGCSFRCPYCREPGLLEPAGEPRAWADLITHLVREDAPFDAVVVTGGEPCDDPDLPAVMTHLKQTGLALRLETNGAHPVVLRHLLAEALVDSVALDVKTSPDRYDALTGVDGSAARVAESIAVIERSGVDHEFRTTLFPGAVTLADLEPMAASLAGARLWAVQQYDPGRALDRRAEHVDPFGAHAVHLALLRCRRHVPTVMRGFAEVSA